MKFYARFVVSLKLLARYPMRTVLLIVSIALAVSAAVVAQAVADAASESFRLALASHGANVGILSCIPQTDRGTSDGVGGCTTFDREIVQEVVGAEYVSFYSSGTMSIRWGDESRAVLAACVEAPFVGVKEIAVIEGRFFSPRDERRKTRVAVVSRSLGGARKIIIDRIPFQVLGVAALDTPSDVVFIPSSICGSRITGPGLEERVVYFRSPQVERDAQRIRDALGVRHREARTRYEIATAKQILRTEREATAALRHVSSLLMVVMIVMGGGGITILMTVTVMQRREEFGVRRAIGATRAQLFAQVVAESIAIGGVGIVGAFVCIGSGGAAIESLVGENLDLSSGRIVLSSAWVLVAGMMGAVVPAALGARVDPARTLKAEE